MRSVDGRGQIRNRYKAALVGALGLRQFHVDPRSLESAHLALAEALALDCIWDGKWKNSARSPEEFRDAALVELDADGQPGPACRELLVKAAGHLTAQAWLKRESRDPNAGFRDQRPADTVLDLMHREPQGVHALAEAVAAGRRGDQACAVQGDGAVIERVAGDTQPITNLWLRQTFASLADREKAPATVAAAAATGPTTPREQVATHVRAMDRLAGDLERALEQARRVADDDGSPFLERRGWTPGEAEPLAERLRVLAGKLSRYGVIADISPTLPPVQDDLFSDRERPA